MPYSRRSAQLKLLPLIIPVGGLFAAGAIVTLLQSFGLMVPGQSGGPGAWPALGSDRWLWKSVIYSLAVAGGSGAVSLVLGTLLAWTIHRMNGVWKNLLQVYRIPLILPHITVAYLVILIFGQSGIISSAAARLGLLQQVSDFPNLLHSGWGTGVALAYIFKETSFVALMVGGQLRKLDEDLVRSAVMLGAGRVAVFRDVVIPHIRPTALSSFLIIWLYALGAFEIPWLIGETKPQMLSVTIYNLYFNGDLARRPEAAAVLSILMVLSALIIFLAIGRQRQKRGY